MNGLKIINKAISIPTIQLQKCIRNHFAITQVFSPTDTPSYLHHQGNHYPAFYVSHYPAILYSFNICRESSKKTSFLVFPISKVFINSILQQYLFFQLTLLTVCFEIYLCSWSLCIITYIVLKYMNASLFLPTLLPIDTHSFWLCVLLHTILPGSFSDMSSVLHVHEFLLGIYQG